MRDVLHLTYTGSKADGAAPFPALALSVGQSRLMPGQHKTSSGPEHDFLLEVLFWPGGRQNQPYDRARNEEGRSKCCHGQGDTSWGGTHLPAAGIALQQAQVIPQDAQPLKAIHILEGPQELFSVSFAPPKPAAMSSHASRDWPA